MRRSIAVTVFVAAALVSVAAVAQEWHSPCHISTVCGTWGFSETGTLYLPTPGGPVAVPYVSVGEYTVDRWGNMSGERTAVRGGPTGATVQRARIEGTATVKGDCTGELNIRLYDPVSGALFNTVVKSVVYVDDSRAAWALITDILMPDGITHVTGVLVTEAKRISP